MSRRELFLRRVGENSKESVKETGDKMKNQVI